MDTGLPMGNILSRLRHRRGFGIHSPYAYMIVKQIIAPPSDYAYYGEARMRCKWQDTDDICVRMAPVIFRWVARMGSKTLVIEKIDDAHKICLDAAKAACAGIQIRGFGDNKESGPDIAIVTGEDIDKTNVADFVKNADGCAIFFPGVSPPDVWRIVKSREKGILFYSKVCSMLVAYPKTSFVSYDMQW